MSKTSIKYCGADILKQILVDERIDGRIYLTSSSLSGSVLRISLMNLNLERNSFHMKYQPQPITMITNKMERKTEKVKMDS